MPKGIFGLDEKTAWLWDDYFEWSNQWKCGLRRLIECEKAEGNVDVGSIGAPVIYFFYVGQGETNEVETMQRRTISFASFGVPLKNQMIKNITLVLTMLPKYSFKYSFHSSFASKE